MSASEPLQAQTETCSDCIERNDVDLLGRVRGGRHQSVGRCLMCGSEVGKRRGNGRVPRKRADVLSWWVSMRGRES